MAEVTKVTVSKGVTISVGQYESVRIDAQVEVRGDGEDSDDLFDIGFETIDEQINKQIDEIQDIVGGKSMFKYEESGKKKGGKRGTK